MRVGRPLTVSPSPDSRLNQRLEERSSSGAVPPSGIIGEENFTRPSILLSGIANYMALFIGEGARRGCREGHRTEAGQRRWASAGCEK